ncbi:PAS domain S-box-containing protein [Methylosinus sp. sav-2]|uniref:sensor histidine kinase n=1 Tax=unclassified Methylosinus TaxID=2624500 RepID=UPI0004673DFB|nr:MULTISPECIES: ATP-binding protein [unclassified Methylosinus]TDX67661.1 PAS domain S-box-containing protein [Methylosinus sp. sav-2]
MSEAATADDWRRLVFDETVAGLVLVDQRGAIIGANPCARRMFGFGAEAEIIGLPLARLLPQASPVVVGSGLGLQGVRRDGARFPVGARFSAIARDGEPLVLATIVDLYETNAEEAALVAHAEELERLNERLARFAFVASQDLQEPLRKIAVFGDLMEEAIRRGDTDEIARANEVMRFSALRARALVQDLLSFSRIVNDELELASLDLRDAIALSLAALSPTIAETEARVEIDLPEVSITADATQFQRLVQNILANAIKYRKPGRPAAVDIKGFCDESSLRLAIADDGIGFEAQYAQKIFEPLKQLHSKVDYPGSGVGLAICKAIADRHGWRLSVEAEPGVGATFFIVLPIRDAQAR